MEASCTAYSRWYFTPHFRIVRQAKDKTNSEQKCVVHPWINMYHHPSQELQSAIMTNTILNMTGAKPHAKEGLSWKNVHNIFFSSRKFLEISTLTNALLIFIKILNLNNLSLSAFQFVNFVAHYRMRTSPLQSDHIFERFISYFTVRQLTTVCFGLRICVVVLGKPISNPRPP